MSARLECCKKTKNLNDICSKNIRIAPRDNTRLHYEKKEKERNLTDNTKKVLAKKRNV